MDDWLGRRPWPGRRCEHLYPTLLVDVAAGGYYARCLGCLEVGPERLSPEAARAPPPSTLSSGRNTRPPRRLPAVWGRGAHIVFRATAFFLTSRPPWTSHATLVLLTQLS